MKALENRVRALFKLTPTQQWMIDHPNDEPCPKGVAQPKHGASHGGMRELTYRERMKLEADRAKPEAAIAEKRKP